MILPIVGFAEKQDLCANKQAVGVGSGKSDGRVLTSCETDFCLFAAIDVYVSPVRWGPHGNNRTNAPLIARSSEHLRERRFSAVHAKSNRKRQETGWMKRLPYGKESDRRREGRHDTGMG